jgi:hypothetical protein
MTDLGQELAANLNRNVMASIRGRAPPQPWLVAFYDGRAFAVSPDWTDLREWREAAGTTLTPSECLRGSAGTRARRISWRNN